MDKPVVCARCLSLLPAGDGVCRFCGARIAASPPGPARADGLRLLSPEQMREVNAGRLVGADLAVVIEQARLRLSQESGVGAPATAEGRCPDCFAAIPERSRFCPSCGRSVLAGAEAGPTAPPQRRLPPDPLTCRTCGVVITPRDAFEFEIRFRNGVTDPDTEEFEREHALRVLEGRGPDSQTERAALQPPSPKPAQPDRWAGMNVVYPDPPDAEMAEEMILPPSSRKLSAEDERRASRSRVGALLSELAEALDERIVRALCRPCPECGEGDPLGVAQEF